MAFVRRLHISEHSFDADWRSMTQEGDGDGHRSKVDSETRAGMEYSRHVSRFWLSQKKPNNIYKAFICSIRWHVMSPVPPSSERVVLVLPGHSESTLGSLSCDRHSWYIISQIYTLSFFQPSIPFMKSSSILRSTTHNQFATDLRRRKCRDPPSTTWQSQRFLVSHPSYG